MLSVVGNIHEAPLYWSKKRHTNGALAMSEDGARTFALQSGVGVKQYVSVATAQAVRTSVEGSSAAAAALPSPAQKDTTPEPGRSTR